MPTWIRPVQAGISDDFAAHKARKSVNPGTDYVVGVGTPVVAVADGSVADIVTTISGAGGRMIYLEFYSGHNADYLHLSRIDVKKGDLVKQGQVIGLSGASGKGSERGYGPHLHFSFRYGGKHLSGGGNEDYEAFIAKQEPVAEAPKAKATAKAKPAPVTRATVHAGRTGEDVKYLQTKLGITADGIFGRQTQAAVLQYQTASGLVADGIVGPKTWAAIG
jgi:murein DD-endopeptidase MepM/ murein hydrolase activator NlpD